MKYFKNAFGNIVSFFTALFSVRIYWKQMVTKLDSCTIDPKAKITGPYRMRLTNIGFGSYVEPNSRISMTNIGRFCSIGPNFWCGYGIHPTEGISTSPAFYSTKKQNGFTYCPIDKIEERKPINIGHDVFIGANVTVLDGVTIGNGAVIGAGAVVSKDIPPYAIAMGCPIKIVKYRFEPEVIDQLQKLEWWNKDEKTFKKIESNFFNVHTFLTEENNAK